MSIYYNSILNSKPWTARQISVTILAGLALLIGLRVGSSVGIAIAAIGAVPFGYMSIRAKYAGVALLMFMAIFAVCVTMRISGDDDLSITIWAAGLAGLLISVLRHFGLIPGVKCG